MNDSHVDQEGTLEVVRQLDASFRRDAEVGLHSARAMSRGSAIFLAHHLGPAVAYDIASKSADDIITEAASELAVRVETAPKSRVAWDEFGMLASVFALGALWGAIVTTLLR